MEIIVIYYIGISLFLLVCGGVWIKCLNNDYEFAKKSWHRQQLLAEKYDEKCKQYWNENCCLKNELKSLKKVESFVTAEKFMALCEEHEYLKARVSRLNHDNENLVKYKEALELLRGR